MGIAVNKPPVEDRDYSGDGRRVIIRQEAPWSPGLAAVLSVVMPGLGQIYNGQILFGLILAFFTFVGYFLLVPGALLHLYSIYQAYRKAYRRSQADRWRVEHGW